jgi:hypothetical protein
MPPFEYVDFWSLMAERFALLLLSLGGLMLLIVIELALIAWKVWTR